MDNFREVVREILPGKGTTKPRFTGYDGPAKLVGFEDTALAWKPLLKLFGARVGCALADVRFH